tara:strand:- start:720 stop:1580 length:861 start_codon:yes stop_codon:yes gene_type:complete
MINKKILITLIFLTSTLFSCKNINNTNNDFRNYELENITIKTNREDGSTHWNLSSKKAEYDKINQITKAVKPILHIYNDDIANIKATSRKISLFEGSSKIILNDNVLIELLTDNKTQIRGEEMIWNPIENTLYISNYSTITFDHGSIRSQKSSLNIKSMDIMFSGNVNLSLLLSKDNNKIQITADNGLWNETTGVIQLDNSVSLDISNLDNTFNHKFKGSVLNGNIYSGDYSIEDCNYTNNNKQLTKSTNCFLSNNIDIKDVRSIILPNIITFKSNEERPVTTIFK